MELVTRYIVRKKNDRELIYKFTTFSSVFDSTTITKPNYLKLKAHLMKTFMFGMEHAPGSPSEEKGIQCEIIELKDHWLTKLAHDSNYYGKGRGQHWAAQIYSLRNHPSAIAVEMPVWDDEFSGCLDELFYTLENDRIIIYDFKPEARKEKHVSGQLFRYAKCMSACTGISMNDMDLFYGDGEVTFQVII